MAIQHSISIDIWANMRPSFLYVYQYLRLFAITIFILAKFNTQAIAQQQVDAATKRAFETLLPGMTMERVREQVGNPTRIEPFKFIHIQTGDTTVCWYYGNNGYTLLFKNKYLDKVERNRDQLLNKMQNWSSPSNPDGIKIYYGK
jgi:hypothetical protein